MKDQLVYVEGAGTGICVEEVSTHCLIQFKHALAWCHKIKEEVKLCTTSTAIQF